MNMFQIKLLATLALVASCGQGNLSARMPTEHRFGKNKESQCQLRQNLTTTTSCTPIAVPSSFAYPLKSEGQCKTTDICQSVFDKKGVNGIIIDEPGVYALKGNISFNPSQPNVQAITITASNVTLDLGSHVLAQVNTQTGVYGIAIARDVHNVKITGSEGVAEILDFTLAGIRVLGRTDVITIENVTVSQTTPVLLTNAVIPANCADLPCALITGGIYVGEGELAGFAFNGTDKHNHVTNLALDHVTVQGCIFGSQIVETYGVQLDNSSFVENSSVGLVLGNNLPIPGDTPDTFELVVCADITIRNCHFDRNVGNSIAITNPTDDPNLFQVVNGIFSNQAQNVVMENCTCSDNFDTFGSTGPLFGGTQNLTVRDCAFDGNIGPNDASQGALFSGSNAFNAACAGIGGTPAGNPGVSLVIENCTANGNQGAGFEFGGVNGARISDCTANGNFTVNTPGAGVEGFLVVGDIENQGNQGLTFLRCTASNNGNTGINAGGAGFELRSNTQNVTFRDCVATENGQSAGSNGGGGFVFNTASIEPPPFTTVTQNIIIDNCIGSGNGLATQGNTFAGGVVLRALSSRPPMMNVLIQDSIFNYNVNGVIADTDIPGLVIKRCEADLNFNSGFNLSAMTSPKLVTKNIAYANGPAGAVNYLGVPAANIVTSTSTALPGGGVVGFKNIAITP